MSAPDLSRRGFGLAALGAGLGIGPMVTAAETATVPSAPLAPGLIDDVRRRFEAFRAAGVDEPVAFLVSGQSDPAAVRAELEATTAALAPGG